MAFTKKRKSIEKNAIFNVFYKLLNIIFPLITSAYLSRVLGPSYIGRVSYAQSIMSYFLVVASLGIGTYGMREIAKRATDMVERSQIFSELFFLNFFSSIVCSIVYTILIVSHISFSRDIKLYLAIGLTLYMNVLNVDWFYTGLEEYAYITLRSFAVKILSIICIFLFVKSQRDYVIYAFILSLANTGNYLLNLYNLKGKVYIKITDLDVKRHLQPVLTLLVTVLATDLYNQVDVTMLGSFRNELEVGYYSNGIKLIRIVYSITTAISATIIPRLSQYYYENNKEAFKRLFYKTLNIILVIAFPAFVGLRILSDQIVIILFGDAFSETIHVVNLLSIMVLIISISYLVGSVVLSATGNEKYLLIATLLGCLVNVVSNVIFIPLWGMNGAAIASILAESVVATIHFAFGYRFFKESDNCVDISSVIIGTSIMAILLKIVRNMVGTGWIGLVVCAIIGGMVYFFTLFILKNSIITYYIKKIFKRLDHQTF